MLFSILPTNKQQTRCVSLPEEGDVVFLHTFRLHVSVPKRDRGHDLHFFLFFDVHPHGLWESFALLLARPVHILLEFAQSFPDPPDFLRADVWGAIWTQTSARRKSGGRRDVATLLAM